MAGKQLWLRSLARHHRTTREAARHGVVNPTLRKPGSSQARVCAASDGDDDYALARDLEHGWHIGDDECDNECDAEPDDEFDAEADFLSLRHLGDRVAELSSAVGTLKRQVSGDSESWSEVASEWSAVSAAESAWTTVVDDPLPSPPLLTRIRSWGTVGDDAALARKLQMEEWDSLLPRPSVAARNARQTAGSAPGRRGAAALVGPTSSGMQARWVPPRQPSVAPAALRQLRDACGLCVVCRDSLALVAWEPCGHLALCEACRGQIPRHQQRYCVVCRTEGAPVHLLRPCNAAGAPGALPPRTEATAEAAAAATAAVAVEDVEEDDEFDEFDLVDVASPSVESGGSSSDEGAAREVHHGGGRLEDGGGSLADGGGSAYDGYGAACDDAEWFEALLRSAGLSVSAHDGTLGTLHPVASRALAEKEQERAAAKGGSKLGYQLAKRQINARAKAAKRSGFMRSAEFECHHPLLYEEARQWREAWDAQEARRRSLPRYLPRYGWRSEQPALMARQRRTRLRVEQRARAQHDPQDVAQCKAEARAAHLGSRQALRELLKSARAEEGERQAMLRRAARAAEAASAGLGGTCRACGQRDACMLAIRCGHMTLCRECWERGGRPAEAKQQDAGHGGQGKGAGSSSGGSACALCHECGGECKLAMQIFRPLA